MIGTPLYVTDGEVVIGATEGFKAHHGYPSESLNKKYFPRTSQFDDVVEKRNTALMEHVVSLLYRKHLPHEVGGSKCANCEGMLN